MEEMDIDDYSRDRSRSPVRNRSNSADGLGEAVSGDSRDSRESKDSTSRRDYSYNRGRYGDRRGGDRGRRDSHRRGGFRGRDYAPRRDYGSGSYSSGSDEYRTKTERNYDNSIFIGNIPFGSTSKDVEDIFKGDLDIIRADIVTSRGQSRGMATVEFSNKEDVRQAIAKYDHYEFRGREIFVRQDYPPPSEKKKDFAPRNKDRYPRGEPGEKSGGRFGSSSRDKFNAAAVKPGTEIFVGNLPFSLNWQALKDLMREAGEVVRADIRTDSWGKSRGFGTVIFKTEEEASNAIEQFQGYEIEGRKLDTRPGRVHNTTDQINDSGPDEFVAPKEVNTNTEFTENVQGDGEKSTIVFASNLPWATNVDDLFELFETVGHVTRAEIQYNEKGKSSGNAVIEFESEEIAETAITSLNNYNYGGRDLTVSFAKYP